MQNDKTSDGVLTITYLRDVSPMLALVSAVRDTNIERHLKADGTKIYVMATIRYEEYMILPSKWLERFSQPAFYTSTYDDKHILYYKRNTNDIWLYCVPLTPININHKITVSAINSQLRPQNSQYRRQKLQYRAQKSPYRPPNHKLTL